MLFISVELSIWRVSIVIKRGASSKEHVSSGLEMCSALRSPKHETCRALSIKVARVV